jgi:aminoglycoside phosphotransferase (APT) family kinase protein
MEEVVRQFAGAQVALRPLAGGLEATVALARVRGRTKTAGVPRRFVVKRLCGAGRREPAVHEQLAAGVAAAPLPAVLGVVREEEAQYLFLEEVAGDPWPWAEVASGALVMRELARLHASTRGKPMIGDWDYEGDLASSAAATLRLAEDLRNAGGARVWRRLGDLRRVIDALPAIRAHLRDAERCWIHGDVHPGNAMLAAGGQGPRIVLIDWARARVGSPLEDVACWLQSLACWVPEVRRRHDTLLREYFEARGWGRTVPAALRRAYWFAAACNALSGAIRYHLAVAADPASTAEARALSGQALAAAHRVIRRAAAYLSRPLRTAG